MGALMMYDGVSCPPRVHGLPIISPYPNPSSQHDDDDGDDDDDEDGDDETLCDLRRRIVLMTIMLIDYENVTMRGKIVILLSRIMLAIGIFLEKGAKSKKKLKS